MEYAGESQVRRGKDVTLGDHWEKNEKNLDYCNIAMLSWGMTGQVYFTSHKARVDMERFIELYHFIASAGVLFPWDGQCLQHL